MTNFDNDEIKEINSFIAKMLPMLEKINLTLDMIENDPRFIIEGKMVRDTLRVLKAVINQSK